MDLLSSDQSVYPRDPNLNESKNETFENLIVKLNQRIMLAWRHDWKVVHAVAKRKLELCGGRGGDVS